MRTIRLLHRVAVDWTADTFGLRGRGSARSRHEDARDRAYALRGVCPMRCTGPPTAGAAVLAGRIGQLAAKGGRP